MANTTQTIIDGLWDRHSALLDELKAHEWRNGTTWFSDRMRELKGVREQIRTREAMLDDVTTVDEPVRTPACCGECGRAITIEEASAFGSQWSDASEDSDDEDDTHYCEDCLLDDFYDC